MDRLQKTATLPAAKAMLQTIVEVRTQYIPYEDEFLKLVAAGDMAAALTPIRTLSRLSPASDSNTQTSLPANNLAKRASGRMASAKQIANAPIGEEWETF